MEPNQFPVVLLQKYLEGTITEPESQALFAWLQGNSMENDPAFEALLQQVYQQSFAEKPALSADAGKRILMRLIASTEGSVNVNNTTVADTVVVPVHRVHLLRRSWFRYAAAAVLVFVISCTVILLMNQHKPTTPAVADVQKTTPAEIPSGTNRAMLKLPNGQEILLDSTRGNIVKSGALTVNNDSGLLNYKGNADIVENHTVVTPRGGQYQIQLPDGTEVWLNAASRITYPTSFNGKERKVTIAGEVYFEVAKNKAKPFIVDVEGKASVEVLGTHFNVNAYTDELGIHTTLLEGSIRMISQQQTVLLKPGQQAQLTGASLTVNNDPDLEIVMAWKNGSFQFNHASVDEVLRQFSRWYDVTIVYEQKIPAILFSGEIKRDLNLSQALVVLEKMGVHFRIADKKLIVMP